MSDRIELRGVRAYGRHGATAGERERPQPLDLNLTLDLDLSAARASDALADTVDYAALHAVLVRLVAERSDALLERLGDAILAEVMRNPRVLAAQLSLAKPGLLAGATPVVIVRATGAQA